MILTVTFKLTAESRQELIDTFGRDCLKFRDDIHAAIAEQGVLDIPGNKCIIRVLFEGGQWKELPAAAG